jgi:alcohol dehydrogenase
MRDRDVWYMPRAGSLDRLVRRTERLPDPGPGEARLSVRAIGLNFADLFACLGLYSATPKAAFIPGLELAGVVETVGAATRPSLVRPGDRVVGLTRFGAYATSVNLDLRYLWPIPTDWSFTEAAAYPVQALTAWYGLIELGALTSGASVLVQSAAGGVGLNALRILAAHDARSVATVGRSEKRDFLVQHFGLAPEQVIVRDRRGFGPQLDRAVAALGLDGFDLVFDALAGPYFRPAYERLRATGRYILYGAADLMPPRARPNYLRLTLRYLGRPRLDPLRMMTDNKSVMAFNLIWLWDQMDRLARAYDRVVTVLPRPPVVGRRFGFSDAPTALRFLQSGESIGKVVLEV